MILRFHSFQFLYICCIYSSEDIENYLNYLKFIKIAINKFFKKKKKKELFDFSFGKQKIRHRCAQPFCIPLYIFRHFTTVSCSCKAKINIRQPFNLW